MHKEIVKPRLIAFEVTRRCRYSCRHCRAAAAADLDEQLSTAQCKKILRSVARFCKCVIILTGGEPMERSDIFELISFGTRLGLRMVMATCGYLIDDDSTAKLKKAGILALSFSLDAASAEMHDKFRESKGAFDATIRAAALAKRAGIRFQINTTISKLNIDEAAGIAELAKQLGAYCYNPFILVPTGRAKDLADYVLDPVEYEALLNELLDMKLNSKIQLRLTCGPQFARVARQSGAEKRLDDVRGCLGGTEFGFISCNGDVQICGFLDISAGNLLENNFSFGKIWRNSEFLKRIRNRAGYTGKCRLCDFVGICGGCRARAFAITGDCFASDPVCDYRVDVKK